VTNYDKYQVSCEIEPRRHPCPEYVQRIDRIPIRTTTNRKLALVMGKFMAEDAIKSLQNSRRIPELISVQVERSQLAI